MFGLRLGGMGLIPRRSGASWSPLTLFLAGEQGGWYDPSDVDRYMSEVGPELVANGPFDTDTAWTKGTGWTISGGKANFTNTSGAAGLTQACLTVGKWYRIEITQSGNNGLGGFSVYSGTTTTEPAVLISMGTTNKSFVGYIFAYSETLFIRGSGTTSASASFDDISVKEVTAISTATMFQDSAGTTPVTAVEQPVGLWLDKRLGALSALGAEKVTNGDFGNGTTNWTTYNNGGGSASFTVSSGQFVVDATASVGSCGYYQDMTTIAGKTYKVSGYVKNVVGVDYVRLWVYDNGFTTQLVTVRASNTADGGATYTAVFTALSTSTRIAGFVGVGAKGIFDDLTVKEVPGNHLIQPTSASRPTYSKRYNLLLATATLSTQSVTVAAGSYTLTFAGAGSITLSGTGSGTYNAGAHTITTTAGSLTLTVSGAVTTADLRRTIHTTMGMPAYQRVTTATDYDETGFLPRVRVLGGDDGMYTAASVDFSGTDEVTVLAGMTKLADPTGGGTVVELSATSASNNGAFTLLAPDPSATNFIMYSRGTTRVWAQSSSIPAPVNGVITGLAKISAPSISLRRNGSEIGSQTGSQGTGNYSNAVLYVGRRNNASLPGEFDIFQLIVRGALTSGATLTSAEQYVAQRTGVTL